MAALTDEQIAQMDAALEMFKVLLVNNLDKPIRDSVENELKQLLKISELVVKQHNSNKELIDTLTQFNRADILGGFISYKYKSPFPQQPSQPGNLPPWANGKPA